MHGHSAPADALWERRISGGHYLAACRILDTCPPCLQDALAARYASIAGDVRRYWVTSDGRVADSWGDAWHDLRGIGRQLRKVRPDTAFDDDAIEGAAARAARFCMTCRTHEAAVDFAERQGVTLPHGPLVTVRGIRRRLNSSDWWRRQLRRRLTRACEELFRRLGFVRAQASPYVSGDALARIRAAARKGQHWLDEMLAVCQDTGETMPLAKIAAGSLANPANRRGELMLRARGFQEIAQSLGHKCLFVTATCPSAFHPWLASGQRNERYNGTSPREAQKWLNTQWARARAGLKKRGVQYYGIRAAEPHHDGTPHWHMILYASPDQLETLQVILQKTWLKTYADELGATTYRIKFTVEDSAKGSGVAYLAKYISKNIDGAGSIGEELSDESGRRVSEDAEAAVAWARLHGIRQFQQLGGPAVGLWRELRRVREPCEWPPIEALRLTTDRTDERGPSWSAFIRELGGIAASLRASRALFDKAEPRCIDSAGRRVLRLTRWGEFPAPMVIGVQMVWRDRIRRLPTRVHVWYLVFAPSGASYLGPVAVTVTGAATLSEQASWTNPHESSQAPPRGSYRPRITIQNASTGPANCLNTRYCAHRIASQEGLRLAKNRLTQGGV